MPSSSSVKISRFPHRTVNLLSCAFAAVTIAACAPSAHAQSQSPVVSAVYTQSGGLFNYNFTVQNLTAFVLADVNVTVPTGVNSVTNLSAPTGFQITFDPGLGLVDFLADANPATPQDFLPGSTVSGFFFSSPTLLDAPAFNALDDQGNSYNGTATITGSTASAPEPGALSLLATSSLPIAMVTIYRRRRFARSRISRSLKG